MVAVETGVPLAHSTRSTSTSWAAAKGILYIEGCQLVHLIVAIYINVCWITVGFKPTIS